MQIFSPQAYSAARLSLLECHRLFVSTIKTTRYNEDQKVEVRHPRDCKMAYAKVHDFYNFRTDGIGESPKRGPRRRDKRSDAIKDDPIKDKEGLRGKKLSVTEGAKKFAEERRENRQK